MKDDQTMPQCEEISVDPYRCSLPAGHTGEHLTRLEELPVSYAPPVPSARTVPRYWATTVNLPSWPEPVEMCLASDVASLLAALAEQDHEIARLKASRDEYKALASVGTWHQDCRPNRRKAAEEIQKSQARIDAIATENISLTARAEAAEAQAEEARMGHVRLDECSDIAGTGHLKLYERIGLKLQKNNEQRAEIEGRYPKLPVDVNEWLAGIAQDREKLQAAEATLARLRGLIRRFGEWDMLDATADGPFWKAQIDAALRAVPPPETQETKHEQN